MTPLPTADWLAALADMDGAIATAIAALDAHAERWPDPPAAARNESPLARLEAKLAGWDERLVAAGRLAEGLELDLADRAAAVGRWREAFTGLRGRIQQPAGPPS